MSGRHVEAIEQFYAPNATMQENLKPPRRGLANLVANERDALAQQKEIATRPVDFFAIDGERVVGVVSIGDLVRIFTFQQSHANMVELTLPAGAPVVGT
ncbi:MAG: hypothetical protein ABL931_05725, partial [Usitatibacteraceae bacterium]